MSGEGRSAERVIVHFFDVHFTNPLPWWEDADIRFDMDMADMADPFEREPHGLSFDSVL